MIGSAQCAVFFIDTNALASTKSWQHLNKRLFFAVIVSAVLSASHASEKPAPQSTRDDFPTGQATAEGAATDLARVFIKKDSALFDSLCIPPYGGEELKSQYKAIREKIKAAMTSESAQQTPSPQGPKQIKTVFAARSLSSNGPASYGYASFEFEDIQFVDVVVLTMDGSSLMNRTLVIKKNGKWYVHPAPSLSPLLSQGLNDESDSVALFTPKRTPLR